MSAPASVNRMTGDRDTTDDDSAPVGTPDVDTGVRLGAYTVEDLAKLGYTAYGEHTGWLNHRGERMPSWTELPEQQRQPYYTMADAIARAARARSDVHRTENGNIVT